MADDVNTYNSNDNVKVGQMIIFLKGLPAAYAKSAKMQINVATVDTSNKFDGVWGSVIAGKRGYTINSESLLTEQKGAQSYHDLIKAMIDGTPLDFQFGTMKSSVDDDGNMTGVAIDTTFPNYKGKVLLTSIDITSEQGAVATNSMQGTGSGKLTTVDPQAAAATAGS